MLMSEARIAAFSWEPFTYVVARAMPFHFTTEAGTNPVPFTVKVNPIPPGEMVSGTSGWLVEGTGFCAIADADSPIKAVLTAANRKQTPQTRIFVRRVRWLVMVDLQRCIKALGL